MTSAAILRVVYFQGEIAESEVTLLPVIQLGYLPHLFSDANSSCSPLLSKHYIYQGECAYLESERLSKQTCNFQV